ncbi:MAG: hypothetical protein RBR06_11015 [Desulfuromonadaceae bacterium]|nr:hypothetical protein [Desulfuromonadaceae bacterium]
MSVFIVAGLMALLMLVYMVAVLGALPWFIYIPFILLFVLAFFWGRIRSILPRFNASSSAAGTERSRAGVMRSKKTRRGGKRGKRNGKRM